jgi:hypothetical protein
MKEASLRIVFFVIDIAQKKDLAPKISSQRSRVSREKASWRFTFHAPKASVETLSTDLKLTRAVICLLSIFFCAVTLLVMTDTFSNLATSTRFSLFIALHCRHQRHDKKMKSFLGAS